MNGIARLWQSHNETVHQIVTYRLFYWVCLVGGGRSSELNPDHLRDCAELLDLPHRWLISDSLILLILPRCGLHAIEVAAAPSRHCLCHCIALVSAPSGIRHR
jgi:hypothetical protein